MPPPNLRMVANLGWALKLVSPPGGFMPAALSRWKG
jgi:hypothetical protein